MTTYEKFCELNIDSQWIGLEKGDLYGGYFCTPINATVIGWENSIHYCFIKGYQDMVFAVNPETCVDQYVYPLAMNFKDFLRLILTCGSTTAVEQIIGWSKEQFEAFLISDDNRMLPEQKFVLDKIKSALKLKPMENPYEYVKSVQRLYKDVEIKFSNVYYDTLELERPDGSVREFEPTMFDTVTFTVVNLEKVLTELILDMNVNAMNTCEENNTPIYFDRTEKDNSKWLVLLHSAIKSARYFEIHCWNEETEWIEIALKYGNLKDSDWKYGKIIAGEVTTEFINMLLEMPKPIDTEIYNKMTPFFNVFLDDYFQSSHYGTEIYMDFERIK